MIRTVTTSTNHSVLRKRKEVNMKLVSIHIIWYPRPYWFILPTIQFSDFRKDRWGTADWTIDLRWLRLMITIAKLRKDISSVKE